MRKPSYNTKHTHTQRTQQTLEVLTKCELALAAALTLSGVRVAGKAYGDIYSQIHISIPIVEIRAVALFS